MLAMPAFSGPNPIWLSPDRPMPMLLLPVLPKPML
ncbi:Uncharacterised protein [Mycobacterium tuberculosis]|nr:Uncharacterised protein [Mycobacterium tuberculosis]